MYDQSHILNKCQMPILHSSSFSLVPSIPFHPIPLHSKSIPCYSMLFYSTYYSIYSFRMKIEDHPPVPETMESWYPHAPPPSQRVDPNAFQSVAWASIWSSQSPPSLLPPRSPPPSPP
eukprot:846939_1